MSPLKFALDFFFMNECDTDAWDDDISKPTVLTCVRFASDVIVQSVITQRHNGIAAFKYDILFRRINFSPIADFKTLFSLRIGIKEWSCNSIIPF